MKFGIESSSGIATQCRVKWACLIWADISAFVGTIQVNDRPSKVESVWAHTPLLRQVFLSYFAWIEADGISKFLKKKWPDFRVALLALVVEDQAWHPYGLEGSIWDILFSLAQPEPSPKECDDNADTIRRLYAMRQSRKGVVSK